MWVCRHPCVCIQRQAYGYEATYKWAFTGLAQTCFAKIGGVTFPLGELPSADVQMTDSGGSVMAQPSALSADWIGFTVQEG